jgi:hypothetical protein
MDDFVKATGGVFYGCEWCCVLNDKVDWESNTALLISISSTDVRWI